MWHAIGATAVSTYAIEADVEFGPADLAGSPVSIPYRKGLIAGSRTLKGRDYPLFLTILGDEMSTGSFNEKVQALTALILNVDANDDPQPFTLTRTMPHGVGTQICTIQAIYKDGLRVARSSPWSGRCVPVLTLLDAYWLSGAMKVYA